MGRRAGGLVWTPARGAGSGVAALGWGPFLLLSGCRAEAARSRAGRFLPVSGVGELCQHPLVNGGEETVLSSKRTSDEADTPSPHRVLCLPVRPARCA